MSDLNVAEGANATNAAPVGLGIIHIGPGAFHRAHQAVYTQDLIDATGGDYGISAISLRTRTLKDLLSRQANEYTLAILDREVSFRTISVIREVLTVQNDLGLILRRFSAPEISTVTLTITEKGYTLGPDGGLDFQHETIRHDLENPAQPVSAIGLIVAGLAKRRAEGLPGMTLISCDNLPDNGHALKAGVLAFAGRVDVDLKSWIEQTCFFPVTMVDSITPKTTDELRQRVDAETGFADAWPVQREAFAQWVIEDVAGANLPPWELVGVQVTNDVQGFEQAKIRILNGLHTTATFFGLLLDLGTVRDAVRHPDLRRFLEFMCRTEIVPTLSPPAELDLNKYVSAVFERFENPEIDHYLSQIAWDSSKKLPMRITATLLQNLAAGRPAPCLTAVLAAWIALVSQYAEEGREVVDPLSEQLLLWTRQKNVPEAFLQMNEVFPGPITESAQNRARLTTLFHKMKSGRGGVLSILRELAG